LRKEGYGMSTTTLQEQLGYRVRRRRMALGWSQVEFAARVDMPQGHISRLERGKYAALNPEKLVMFAKVLETTSDYLLGLSDDPDTLTALTDHRARKRTTKRIPAPAQRQRASQTP
jgi:transcriptional regulator with XRE-family HTH domain